MRVLAAYLATALALAAAWMAVGDSGWSGSSELHTFMETVASGLALVVGVLALVRHYSHRENRLLLIGSGFLGTAFLDGYHALVSSPHFAGHLASELDPLDSWSWFASRSFLSLLLVWSWTAWRREERLGGERRLEERRVYLQVVALSLTCAAFLAVIPLPSTYHPSLALPRPQELIPGSLLLVALVGYLGQGRWRSQPFERWLVPSILVGLAVQVPFIAGSERLYDGAFEAAHLLKIVSYALVLVGLLASMYGLFVEYEHSVREAGQANEALRREVHERARVEEALRHSEEKYRTILETIGEGYFEVDRSGRLVFFNPSLVRFLGSRPDRLAGVDLRSFTDQENGKILQQAFTRLCDTGEPIESLGFEIVRSDGSRRFVEASMLPIRDDLGAIVGARGMARDVTERREAERDLARSHAELQQFAYVASHDLQEPLRMVAGYTRLLARRYIGQLGDEADEFIQFVVDGVTRMQNLINDLLQYSRVESHGTRFEPVSSATALEWARSNLETSIKESGATVTAGPLPTVTADPTQLGRLFQNLIGNGVKFRGDRVPEVHVEARRNDREWVFSVSDNGIGIEPPYRERIFEIFQRLHTQEHYDGTGVGLAICRRIVERHGGRIWVESTPGEGSAFHFTIPDGASDARKASA